MRGTVAHVRQFGEALSDLRPYWPAVTVTVREILSESFESEGQSGRGGRWPNLEPPYEAWKARHYPGRKILERTGELKASLIGGPGGRVTYGRTSMEVASDVPYGSFHQEGKGQKKRSPWSPTDRDAFRIVNTLSKAIRGVLEPVGAAL